MKSKISLLALALIASFAAQANDAVHTSTFTNGVQSFSGAMAATSGNGASLSTASNTQFAVNQGTSGASFTPDSATGFVNGVGVTGSTSTAQNVSTGSGTGVAAANGASLITASTGVTLENGSISGSILGSLGSVAQTGVSTGTNGSATITGTNTVNYNGTATAGLTMTPDFILTNAANTTASADSTTVGTNAVTGTGLIELNNVGGTALVNANIKIGDVISTAVSPL